MEAAAGEIRRLGGIPFAAYCSDPCDGRSQGTAGMFDSLPYRNDAALVMRRPDPLAADSPRRHRRRHLRQGAARGADRPRRDPRASGRRDPRGGHPAPGARRRRRQDPVCRGAPGPRRDHHRRGQRLRLPGLCHRRGRLPVPRHRRDLAGRRRGARADPAARRPRSFRGAGLVRHGDAHRAGGDGVGKRRDRLAGPADRCGVPQRHGHPRRLRRLDQPDPARAGDRLRSRATAPHRRGLGPPQPHGAPPRRRAAERSAVPPDRARLPGRRGAGGDAAPARPRAARGRGPDRNRKAPRGEPRLVGEQRAPGPLQGSVCARRTASTRTR